MAMGTKPGYHGNLAQAICKQAHTDLNKPTTMRCTHLAAHCNNVESAAGASKCWQL